MSHYFKNIKYHGLLLKNPMVCYKNRPIWSFQSIPGVFEREFTVSLYGIFFLEQSRILKVIFGIMTSHLSGVIFDKKNFKNKKTQEIYFSNLILINIHTKKYYYSGSKILKVSETIFLSRDEVVTFNFYSCL